MQEVLHMEASTERTVTVLSKRDPETRQLLLHTCTLHLGDGGIVVFTDGRAENVPVRIARMLLDSRADVEVPGIDAINELESAAAAAPAPVEAEGEPELTGEEVEEPIREPPGKPAPPSPEEERERAIAAVTMLREEGDEVPRELLIAAGEIEDDDETEATFDVDLGAFNLDADQQAAVVSLMLEGEDAVRAAALDLAVSPPEASVVELAVNVVRARASVDREQPPAESGSQEGAQGAQGAATGEGDPSPAPADPAGSAPEDPQVPSHVKAVPEGFDARTGEGELRCLATTSSGKQCSNAAVSGSACGLEPHKAKVADLPDAT